MGWTVDARREQLELAENHLLDAIDNVVPTDPDRRESPLNLQVSLALTYDVRARLESSDNNSPLGEEYRRKAERAYQAAQALDADNTYVLENYARFKLNEAERLEPGIERTGVIVDAIELLDWEREADELRRRDEATLTELARAYSLLEDHDGLEIVRRLADQGSEAALIALAKVTLREAGTAVSEQTLADVEGYLQRVPPEAATWRSRGVLYRIVSRRTPHDFRRRLDILEELAASREFPWPLQLRLEYGILSYQAGDSGGRTKGRDIFREIRELLPERSGSVNIPRELRYLADPATGFHERLKTSMVITNVSGLNRNYYAIPDGWHTIEIPFRPHLFGGRLRRNDERDCFIQFSNFGPQAVPTTIGD
jgi:hypothetical protein